MKKAGKTYVQHPNYSLKYEQTYLRWCVFAWDNARDFQCLLIENVLWDIRWDRLLRNMRFAEMRRKNSRCLSRKYPATFNISFSKNERIIGSIYGGNSFQSLGFADASSRSMSFYPFQLRSSARPHPLFGIFGSTKSIAKPFNYLSTKTLVTASWN